MSGERLLLVDDDPRVLAAVGRRLGFEGFVVDLAASGAEALELFAARTPDLVILDVMMPGMDGMETARRLRHLSDVPILMLSAADTIADRVTGLRSGADDYLVKPFAFGELLARIRALLRRDAPSRDATVRVADLTLDPAAQRIDWQGRPLDLTAREYRILDVLMRRPNWIVSRESLIESVWGYDFTDTSNLVEVYVGRIRRKLAEVGAPSMIQTVRGAGYRLREPVA